MKHALLVAPLAFILLGCGQSPSVAQNDTLPESATEPASSASQPAAGQQQLQPRAQTAAKPAATRPSPAAGVQLLAGTPLSVRLVQTLSTERNNDGDRFEATLTAPVTRNGAVLIPSGASFEGRIVSADSSGRLAGRGHMNVTLESFILNGKTYPIETSVVSRVTADHKKRNVTAIGGGTGIGAVIGGIVGGGKGAAIGAASGAAAGTAGAALTGKMEVVIPSETVLEFTLNAPVMVIP